MITKIIEITDMHLLYILICNSGYVISICNLIDFGYDRLRTDHDFPHCNKGQFCTQLTAPNLLYHNSLTNRALLLVGTRLWPWGRWCPWWSGGRGRRCSTLGPAPGTSLYPFYPRFIQCGAIRWEKFLRRCKYLRNFNVKILIFQKDWMKCICNKTLNNLEPINWRKK